MVAVLTPVYAALINSSGQGGIMETINWDAVSALSEALGVVAVVASLIFVGFQIRQNAESTRSATVAQCLNISTSWAGTLGSDKATAAVFVRGLADPQSLDVEEKSQFAMLLLSLCRAHSNSQYQFRQGLLDEQIWTAVQRTMKTAFSQPGFAWWWPKYQEGFTEDFSKMVEELVET